MERIFAYLDLKKSSGNYCCNIFRFATLKMSVKYNSSHGTQPPLRPKARPIQAGFLTLFLTARTFHVCIESIGHYRIRLKNRVYDIPQRSWTFFKPSARTASAVKSPLYGKRLGLVHGKNAKGKMSVADILEFEPTFPSTM